MMSIFHKHLWIETGRVKIPALEFQKIDTTGVQCTRDVLSACMDRTAVHLRCSYCGDVSSRTLSGWLLDKE